MAANKERGEKSIQIGNKSYVMKMTFNSMCEMETLSGRTHDEIMARVNKGSLSDVRFLFWAALQPNYPDMTVLQVGELIDEGGGIVEVCQQIMSLIELNTEEAKKVPPANGANGGNPLEAQPGTGDGSMSMPVAPV